MLFSNQERAHIKEAILEGLVKDYSRMVKSRSSRGSVIFSKKHPIAAGMVVPKNEWERKKLAKRGVAGHIGHGLLRYLGGGQAGLGSNPVVGVGTGLANVARYAMKVRNAKRGLQRKYSAKRRIQRSR